jgi:hypothetical protein
LDEIVKYLNLGKKDLKNKKFVRLQWRRSWEIAWDQVDLEISKVVLVPRINSVSLWLVYDRIWKPIDTAKISIDGVENIFFTIATINIRMATN